MGSDIDIRITRRFHFSASHRYWVDGWSDEENVARFGKNTQPHGHNYVLEVTLAGPVNEDSGMILNLRDVKAFVNEILEKYYDHRNLNVDHPVLKDCQPTTERIALELAREVSAKLELPVKLHRIKLWETEDLYAEVIWP